jgi:hypothetical protein
MKLQEIKEIAKKNGIKAGKMSKLELTRAIQSLKVIMIALRHHMSTTAIKSIAFGVKIV